MVVSNMINARGNVAANQFIINDFENNIVIFQSYDSKICEIHTADNMILVSSEWDYSATTLKHFKIFLQQYASLPNYSKAELIKYLNCGKLGKYTFELKLRKH